MAPLRYSRTWCLLYFLRTSKENWLPVQIVLIDNYDSFTHNLAAAFRTVALSHSFKAKKIPEVTVIRNDEWSLEELREFKPSVLVISPGPGSPRGPSRTGGTGLSEAACTYFRGNVPVFGVCLGLQLLLAMDGAQVGVSDEPVHGKTSLIEHDERGLFEDCENPTLVARYHSLGVAVEALPSGWDLTAWSSDGLVMAAQHRYEPTYAVQFHPESFMTPKGPQLIDRFLAIAERRIGTSKRRTRRQRRTQPSQLEYSDQGSQPRRES